MIKRLGLIAALTVILAASVWAQPETEAPASSPRQTIAAAQAIGPGGIQELKAVEIGGIKQWISVRGNDPKNPILLFLHGGPGSPMMPESWIFQRPWEDYFTMVQWDQRGAGKTFTESGGRPDPSMTIERMQADAEELIDLLRKSYGKKKIFLMGHSWGSILGLRIAQHRPDRLYAYIGVGQVVNARRNEVVGYRETLAEADRVGNTHAVEALKALAPYPHPDGSTPLEKVIAERQWVVALGGMRYGKTVDDSLEIRSLSPDYSDAEVAATPEGELGSVQALLGEMFTVDFDAVTTFKCPIVFFAGKVDRTTPTSIVEDYYERIQAPTKKLFKIERAAHYVVNEAPGEVLLKLVLNVRPLAESDVQR